MRGEMSLGMAVGALTFWLLASATPAIQAQEVKPVAATGQRTSGSGNNVPRYGSAVKDAQQLSPQSREAFLRGLMPLADYLEHRAVIYETEARNAYDALSRDARSKPGYESNRPPQIDPKQLEKTFRPVYEARLAALQEAADRLEAFRQPAATGWTADVALAKLALQQARLDTAKLLGKRFAVIELSEDERQLAADHYWKRLQDARAGQASLPAMIQAAALLNVAPELRRELSQNAANQTVIWQSRGAGIGRSDAVTQAQLDLSWLDAYRTRTNGKLQVNEATWRESDQLAERLFAEQSAFQTKGTASLADMSRVWQLREQMHDIAGEAKFPIPKASQEQQQQNWQKLHEIAAATTDLRGRKAADVTFVQLIGDLSTAKAAP